MRRTTIHVLAPIMMVGLMVMAGCQGTQTADHGKSYKTAPMNNLGGRSNVPIVVDPANPPKDGAKIIREYDSISFGHTQLRDDNYHRHAYPGGGWTPWHHVENTHQWPRTAKAPAPAPAPAPKPAPAPVAGMVRSSMYYPSGYRNSSFLWIEKSAPRLIQVDNEFEYIITATSLVDQEIKNVKVTDKMPDGFKLAGTSPQAQRDQSYLNWDLGSFAPRQKKALTVRGSLGEATEVTHCATGSGILTACVTQVAVQPSLKLSKQLPNEVLICDTIPMTLVVTNTGTGNATNVKVTDTLPAGLKSTDGQQTLTFHVGTLGSGQSRKLAATLKAGKTGRFDNTANAAADGNLKASAKDSVTVRQPVLTIDKTGPAKLFLGGKITYTIKVTNTGDGVAAGATLVDTIPTGASFVSATAGGTANGRRVTWNLGNLQPRQSRTVSVTVNPSNIGTYTNVAKASAKCATDVSDKVTTKVEGIPAILLEVIDVEDPIQVGDTETYVITVTNQGSATDTNIKIVCTLEPEMSHVSSGGATRSTAADRTVTFAPLASLAPKAKATWQVKVKAEKPGDVRFKVSMTSNQIGRPVEETEATNFYQ